MAVIWGGIAKIGMMLRMNGNDWAGVPLIYMGGAGIMLNVVLGVLNLIPIPPLDGGKLLEAALPKRVAYKVSLIEPYGFFILILLMLSGLLFTIMAPIVSGIIAAIGDVYVL